MNRFILPCLLALTLAVGLVPFTAQAGGKTVQVKEDASTVKSLQQQIQDLDLRISVLKTDDTKIDTNAKMKPEARAEAIKDAKEAVDRASKEVAEASKGKTLNASHAKSFNSRLHDAKRYLTDAAKKAKEARTVK